MKATLIRLGVATYLGFVAAVGAHADGARPSPACAIETRDITVGGGTIAYNTAGSGRTVLLVHGLFADKEQWNGILCRLSAAGFAAIAPDLPGYGKSSGYPIGDYRLERQVALLREFASALSVARFDLAGSSMGGAIAALYADANPRQVRSLAFVGSPLGVVGWADPLRQAIYEGINPFIPVDVAQFDVEMRLLFVNPPPIPPAAKERAVADYVARNLHYQQVWNIVNLYDDVLQRTPAHRRPTLILWGRDDTIFPVAGAARLHQRMPGSAVHTLPEAGHLLLMESADAAADRYIPFLRRVRP